MRFARSQRPDLCPLTVIGGFLGAGKTTFLNRLLATATGRYAVLVNDFGAVNVDAGLVVDHDGQTIRLTNGCVCCSMGDSFLDTLMRVLDETPAFDHVVIEASGVGDPWAIAEIALIEPELKLDGVIVLADAERIATLLTDERVGDGVARQIRAADIVILNKIDLFEHPDALDAARAAITGLRPGLRVVEAVRATLPDDLIGLGGAAPTRARLRAEAVCHEDTFTRLAYRREGSLNRPALADALAKLPASLLRLKGSCTVAGCAEPQLLQLVGRRWDLTDAPSRLMGSWPIELVGIGLHDLRVDSVEAILDDALVDAGLVPKAHHVHHGLREDPACL